MSHFDLLKKFESLAELKFDQKIETLAELKFDPNF